MSAGQLALSTLLIVACTGCSLSAPRPGVAPPSQEPSSRSAGQPVAPPITEVQAANREAVYRGSVDPSMAPPPALGQHAFQEAAHQEGADSAVPPSPRGQLDEGETGDQPMAPADQDAQAADEDLGQAPDSGQVDLGFFYARLAPYGHWVLGGAYGWVWVPTGVAAGWRPYSLGHWVLTRYGWTWISSERFGWVTYHYGRWV